MAWDTERTRRLLLEAAVEEFAEHGPEGARVAKIAARAGVNKERIYQYFGDKQGLFAAVLTDELAKLAAAIPLPADQTPDLVEHAGQLYDYHRAHPHFLRLLYWEGLQRDATVQAGPERAGHYADKVASIAEAQRRGEVTGEIAPEFLLYSVAALAAWWFASPHVTRMILGPAADDPQAQRVALVTLVDRIQRNKPDH
ncbi:TetR family transcriptional regulator [Nonomuraea soli]|uniref:AcrR family transcriptional regulator n=1 Tax=Nonomuraea soli TaxID=1032476 RepID=A0A7W0CIV2_9ACTN|nr:TetR family transcriptional regulator [Nonomuraea soli]MBA2891869.1 AcrR family transcriptional regulator [Nonomuraea soli]